MKIFNHRYNSITNKLSGVYSSSTQVAANLPAGTVSSSGQINVGATSNFATAVAAQLGTVHSGSFMSTATTNNLPEGVTNLYYTDARVKAKLSNDVVHFIPFTEISSSQGDTPFPMGLQTTRLKRTTKTLQVRCII